MPKFKRKAQIESSKRCLSQKEDLKFHKIHKVLKMSCKTFIGNDLDFKEKFKCDQGRMQIYQDQGILVVLALEVGFRTTMLLHRVRCRQLQCKGILSVRELIRVLIAHNMNNMVMESLNHQFKEVKSNLRCGQPKSFLTMHYQIMTTNPIILLHLAVSGPKSRNSNKFKMNKD